MDPHRLAEERSIAYHRVIAGRLRDRPEILDNARRRVQEWLAARDAMTREQLEHLIRAAAVIAADDSIVVIGSQAILGQFPDAPEPMRLSVEADL
ncbi:MAG TPA: hypothetical protein VEW48_20540 [Thermoanaerobaculia bacterium]|nr:hypothetical protein [Thermoanaerobaculia bacterium]